jgi:putative dimethyl sulfoxide reductase chaperone
MTINKDLNNLLKGYNMLLNFAGSLITNQPNNEIINEFWSNGILKRLPVSSKNPRFVLATSVLRGSCDNECRCADKMKEDYNRLFNDSSEPLASPYESRYQNNYYLTTGMNPVGVNDFYNSYGLQSKFNTRKPDDHLGTELLFLTLLIDKYLEMDDKFCLAEMKSEIRRFIQQHILSWIGEWNDRVQIHSQTTCYKGIGTLIYACSEDIYQILE